MRRQLLIGAGPGEWRAAWLEDGLAAELFVERGTPLPAGGIHLGRIVRQTPGLDAALVDIGDERPAFLPVRAVPEPDLTEGARIVVQIRREAQRGKGALLSARIVPRAGAGDPARLTALAAALDPPAQLDPAPGFAATLALRLPGQPQQILTDDSAILRELREAFPAAEIAHRRVEDWPADLDALIDAALSPTVTVPGGGSLHIEETEAAVLIDVDTGTPEAGPAARTALAVNRAAAQGIARQLRLRQLGGGIIVDFVGLDGKGPRERLRQAMAAALAGDPAQPEVLGWTRLGHLEIVRPRRLRPLSDAMLEPRTTQKSAVALAFEALRALAREARAHPAANWRLVVVPAVVAALSGPAAGALRALETRLGRKVAVVAADGGDISPFDTVAL
ncbi:MAG: ribonuclease E/G [Alphaproteobacteria bacterium]